jgi:hypothetical protein
MRARLSSVRATFKRTPSLVEASDGSYRGSEIDSAVWAILPLKPLRPHYLAPAPGAYSSRSRRMLSGASGWPWIGMTTGQAATSRSPILDGIDVLIKKIETRKAALHPEGG